MTNQIATVNAPNIRHLARTATFVGFTALIFFGPFAAQILGVNNPLFRPWYMFAGVGVDIPKGEFTATARDGTVTRLTPLQVLGIKHYPVMLSFEFQTRAEGKDGMQKFAQAFCAKNDVKLTFRGHVGSRQGWRPLEAGDLCANGQ